MIETVHKIEITEEERQMVLMALSHLAVERPGWDWALRQVAIKIDNESIKDVDQDKEWPQPEMYNEFKKMHKAQVTAEKRFQRWRWEVLLGVAD